MRYPAAVVLILAALFAIGAGATSVALAVEGPHWMVEGKALNEGEERVTIGKNVGNFTFIGEGTTTICSHDTSTGTVGSLASGSVNTTFTECVVEGKTEAECHVKSPGQPVGTVISASNSEIVFTGTKTQAEKEEGALGIRLTPKGAIFGESELSGTNCQTSGIVKTKGSTVAELEPVAVETEVEKATFPSVPIAKAWKWESSKKVQELKLSLKASGTSSVVMIGQQEIKLESGEKWGAYR